MANDTNRRRKFYDQMSESYDLGSFEEFDKKMNDAASRKRLHEFIDKDGKYDIGTFEYFDEAMRPANEPSASGMIASAVVPQTESSAKYLTRIGGSEQGLPEGVFYSDEVMRRHGSPKNRRGNYKDLSQIAREVASAGGEAFTAEDRPSPLRPEEPKIELPFMQGATEREDLKHSPNLNKYWANAQQEAARRAMEAKPTAQDFEYRMEGWEEAAKADAIRKANRGEFDQQHLDELYKNHVAPAFKEERATGEQRAREQVNKMLEQPKVPDNPAMATSGFQNAFNTAVISERETDPAKIAEATIKRVQQDDAFGDYVLKRMGISDQGGGQGESEPLSEREKKFMQLLFSRETSEVADQLTQRMYDQYKAAGAPKNALEYIAGKAFHENMMASLFDAMVRRVAGSSGMRQQLRAMASEEYGDEASFATRMLGGAAPFAVDLATGAFTLPSIAGGIASRGLMRGGAKILSRQVTKELEKRAAARGLEDAALREAASGGADIAERYLATQSPIMNVAVRSVGSAANFGTYDVQNGLIRQFGEGEFDAGELFKEAVHGAMLGGVMGVAGGSIANATRNSGLAGRIAGDIAGITSEVGIFAAANGIQKAMDEGISITDVDWADTTGEALGMVAGMKLAGMVSHPSRELFHRYQKSKDFGMQLNQRDIDELKQAGYDFDGIFQGLGQFGKIAPVSKTITRGMEGVSAKSVDQTNKEACIDTTAYNELMKNPNIASSTKRKIAYIATGQVLSVEPAFSVVMNNDNGHITVTTKNVFGNVIETRDYTSEKEAQRDYDIQKAASRINTIDGLERVAAQSGYPDVISRAKDKTMEETGANVDDALMGRITDKQLSDLTLDTYVRNLSDAYNSRYSRALEDATGMIEQPDGEAAEGTASPRRERRQEAYERGKSVSVDEGQLADIGYESQLSEARLMQLMPDGEQSGIIRQQIMDALDTGDIEAAEAILQRQSPYLSEQQREAIESYIDTFETSFGVDDAVSEMTEDYEQQRREELSVISDDHGNITRVILKDGTEAYYQAGDLNGFHSQVIVTNDQGETRQISSSDIQEVVPSVSAENILSDDVQNYEESLRERYQLLSQGNMLLDGQQTDIAIGNQLFRVTNAGQDDNGNYYLQMPDGSQMPMTPQQLSQSIAAAKDFKIQQELAQERQADALRQRTERFMQGIVGYEQGTPDLTAKDTKPEVAAEFLLAATGPDGEPVDRKTVLDRIQTQVDQLNNNKQQTQAALQQASNDMAMADDGETDAVRQRTEQLESQLSAIDAQRRKWGEIRQAMMTDEERQAFEKDRIKTINTAKTQSKKDAEPVGEPTGTVAIPSKEDVVAQYPERTDGEAFVEEQRKQLSQTYKNDVFPQYDDIQKTLGDYQHGLIDLTDDEIKAFTDQSARLSMQMDALVAQQNAWKKLANDLGREYGKIERESMNPHDLAMSRLQNETDKTKKIKLAQEAFKDDEMALNVLDNLEPQDINEFVAANLGTGSINWEGLQRGEHYVRGLRDELGKDKTRGIGAKYDTNAYNQFLAPEGQGKGIDEVVHHMAEGSPYDPQDVKNALLTMLSEATKPTDISHYIENSRIAKAERIYEANLQRERDAELEAEDEAIRQMTGMEPEEYDAFMGDLEQRLAEQEGYRTSEEYFKNILEDERAREERSLGGSQEASALGMQRQESNKAGASQEGQGGTGEADEQLKKVNKDIDVLSKKYNSLAPVEAVDSRNLTDEQIQDIAGQQLTPEEIEEGRELLRNAKTPSFYSPFSKKIYIFADKYNPDETEEWFFHENVHRGLDQYYGDNPIEVAEAFWNTESPTKPEVTAKHKEAIQRVYADKDEATQHEEYLVHILGHYMTTGKVDRLLERMSPEHQEIIENILKNVKYDTAKESVTRNPEEAVQLEGGNEEDALQQKGGDTGRGVSKSSIQGLEDYSEDEIKDIVRNFAETQIADAEADAQIVDMKIIGSRTTGTAKPDSDLDVLLEYTGREREDGFFNLLHDADEPLVINGITIDINPITKGKSGTIAEFLERNKDYDTLRDKRNMPFADRLQAAKGETNVNPTEEQKKAGNYKMGHIRFGGYRMSIENPKGSTRSGVDRNGQPWSIEMQDSYGYIGQKYGTDGDHLDFFINDDADLDTWNGRVYVVDQKNEDGTFDEHKVMYGYPTFAAAKRAYERNYEPGWWDKHVMQMTGMKKENFDQWLADSDHKRKPFAEYSRTRHADTVSSNVDQLLSDIKAREEATPQQTQHILRASELEGKSTDELRQLRKKEMQDRSMAKVLLGTTDAVKDTDKERILQDNIMRAEVNIKSIDEALKKQADAFRQHAEQLEIGGAMVDRLEDMGFEVSTNPRENRRIRKIAEKDNSEEGKMRHFETRDGQIYGFTYKGKMYLDVTKIDAELPIHEYAHPWCEAFRRLNPEGWKNIVDLMKGDKDTWDFIKRINPDLKGDDDIAEEMIAKFSGKKGEERARAEYERMNGKDPEYKSKWGNIWQNISKAIQDFWKQVGDFLHIKYKSTEQVYDQVVRDFANKINPRKRVEDWLKERDQEYLDAVKQGDEAKAKELFDAALRENIGNGITPFVAVDGYRGKMQKLAHGVKTRDTKVIAQVADLMAPLIPKDAVLVPAPSHTGKATDMLDLANAISERTGAPVADVLTSGERDSQYEAKYAGRPLSAAEMGIVAATESLPAGKIPVVIDNVVDTGNTAEACVQALGKGIVASLANSVGRYKRVASLKSAEPVVTDKNGEVVPLSKRFELGRKADVTRQHAGQVMPEFMIEEGNLFDNEDFEEPATVVSMPRINKYGLNETSPIGKKLTDLKQQAGEKTIVGYVDSETGNYVVLGNDAELVEKAAGGRGITTGMQDGMPSVTIVSDFDILSPKMVRDGYKFAFTTDETAPVKEEPKAEPTEEPVAVKDADTLMQEVERRQKAAEAKADKKAADDAVKKFLSRQPKNEEEKIRQRATKAVLKTLDKAGVPYKVVSKEEENQMMKLFSMMNQEAVKAFARRVDIRSQQPHGVGKYCVYNMNNPFGVPIYAEKLSVAKFEQAQLQRMVPNGEWAILNIGYADEAVDNNELRNAEDMNVGDLQAMIGWHGSGQVFTKFDHSHMGEGAGSQAFGWGTYITSGRGVAEGYAHKDEIIKKYNGVIVNPDPYSDNAADRAMFYVQQEHGVNNAIKFLKDLIREEEDKSVINDYQETIKVLQDKDNWSDADKVLYKVDIPEDTGENYLEYKTPVGEELAKKIRDFVYNHVLTSENKGVYKDMDADVIRTDIDRVIEPESNMPWMQRALEARGVTPKEFSQWLSSQGYVGIKYPAGTIMGGGDGATNYVIFNEDDAKITNTIQFMIGDESDNGPVFVSNALQAVEGIKQEKGTAEQWLAMIQKNGGLKAGEDKWLGLSEWLNEHKGEKLTKQDVLDFIRQNQVQVEDVNYTEAPDIDANPRMQEFRNEFGELVKKYEEKANKAAEAVEQFNIRMAEKYGYGWVAKLNEKEEKLYNQTSQDYKNDYVDNDPRDLAFKEMVDKYGDDFDMAFEVNYGNGRLEPRFDMYGEDMADAAKSFLALDDNIIESTRLNYTTSKLRNKREIALVVPTIEPYKESDHIHFGDAGGGRAVAWVRFGDTEVHDPAIRKSLDSASEELYDFLDRMQEKYGGNPDDPDTYWDKLTPEEKEEYKRIMANIRKYDEADEANTKKVLVIDEIQSKRHQDGREKGYRRSIRAERDAVAKIWSDSGRTDDNAYKRLQALNQELRNWEEHGQWKDNKVPDAPFEKNWHELAMKRMLRYAAENGYDKIAWTTGEQQAERYNIGNVVEKIISYDYPEVNDSDGRKTKKIEVRLKNGETMTMRVAQNGMVIEGRSDTEGKNLADVVGKDLAKRIMGGEGKDGTIFDANKDLPAKVIEGDGLRIGAEGMAGFYDEILPRFMNKYGKKWGVKVGEVELPGLEKSAQKMWSIDVTPEMKESVMQGQPMFQKEGKRILGWSDGKQVYLTEAGLNPNTPVHECTHLWDKWCMKEQPELWKKLVAAMKKTAMWEEISKNPNYRNIWNDEDRMASEVHSRLSGAQSEEEFTKAAFKKDTPQGIINEVKSVLRKFWEAVLRLFNKHTKTIADDFESLQSIIRMPLRDLLNQDFEKVMRVAGEDAVSSGDLSLMGGDVMLKTLMGVHNISEDKLKKAIKQGGLANPSLAIIDTQNGIHTSYGEISLIPKASLIDSKTGRNAGTYTGDAYTPTYPNVQRMITKQGEKSIQRIAKEVAGGDAELEQHLKRNMYDYAEGNASRLHLLYLLQKGIKPDFLKERTTHSQEEYDAITKIFGKPQSNLSVDFTDEQGQALVDLMADLYEKKLRESEKPGSKFYERIKQLNDQRIKEYRDGLVDENGRLWFAKGDNFIYENWRDEKRRQNAPIDWYGTDNEASYRVAKEGLSEDYEKWKEGELFGDGDFDEKLFAGWTPDGNKRYVANTIENASRLMNKEADTNAYDEHGLNATKSSLLKRLTTLSDIRKAKHLLKGEEAYNETQKEMSDELFDIIHQLSDMQVISDNSFMNIDYAEARLQEAITKRDPIAYLNKEFGYDIAKDSEYASQLMNFIEKAKELPAKYFETKFKRPVGLGEFAIAVVPENTSPDVIQSLKDAGLEVHTYDGTDEGRKVATMNTVGMRNDILFHIEDDDDTVARLELLRRGEAAIETVNAKFNKDLESLNDKSVLMLGSPSQVLLSTGIKNKPMKLYGTKLIAKAKKHGYEPADIKNLPSAVASPLAVFTGSHPDSFAILTVLKIKGNNVLVSISPSNDVNDVDFNIISSVYDKKGNSVIRWINEGKGLYYDKEKALTYLRHSTPIVETTDKQELDSAAKIVNSFENPKLSNEKIHEIYPEYTEAGDATAEQLGGVGVIWEQQTMEPGTKGWYNPNDNTVHVAIDEVEDVDDVKRTVFHEKLGHEGLVALLGSQAAVNKFGSFVFGSASKAIRQRIMEKADEIDPQWTKHDRFSTAAQEVLADIAADGPKTADEFDLWTKVKHYLIRFLNKIGLKIRGLLNDHDLSYYILKTGEALKRWDKMSDKEKADMMHQSTGQEILRSRRGKPRKRNNESDAQYFQRLTAWEKWRIAHQTARDNGDPEPTEEQFHEQAEADFRAAMEQWRRDNNIGENESFNQPFPRRNADETPQEYAVRVADFEAQHDLWATAPQYMDFISRANEKYRRAYTEWRERYDLQEEASVDQRLYEGDIDPEPTYTDAEVEAREMAEKEIADELGYEIDEEGAKRMAKLAVIERRKNFESANAEDAIWVYDFMKQTDAVAKQIAERTGQKVTGKEIREALPFLIEADRRKENMDAEREDAIMAINMSEAIQQAHSFVDYYNLDEIDDELKALNDAWQHQEAEPDVREKQAYREAAARLAEKLNSLNADKAGYNPLFADDVMQIRSLLTSAAVSGKGAIMPEHAERFADMPEMQPLMEHVKEWYDEFYQVLEDAGLRGDAGYIEEGYVNHVWDKEKSDASAWEKYIENRQRTKSPNMRHREIDTYMDGISVGLVPKYTDIADMIAHYSRQNNEAVANSKFLDDLKFVYVQELNDAGEVVAVLPLLQQEKPDAILRDHYAQYYVPGVGDVYVMKPVQKRFANIFGTMRTPDAAEWLSKLGKAYDLTSSTAKKIQLALSGFHALALFEVDVAQNNPAVALKHLLKYIVGDSFKSGTLPAYAHPDDFRLAAKHLVQLGATEDYAAADVNAITARIRETFKALGESDEVWKKAAGVAGSPAAIFMDWINKGFDTVLWNYLHDGLKLSAFKELVKQVDARVEKEGLDDKMREQLLDEAGQYVNDMFGGQYWELLNISPATLKWMRRLFLSPDWLLSTQRHFFANFGIGSVYSDGGFREYIKYNWDNIKRVFGSNTPHDELRRLRSKNAKYCYLVGALVWWHVFYNAINALMRWMDEEDEKEKAEEERKTNPDYKSPYELAYPNGMKWYDYTMWGNTIGQQTHLFTGRYSDGTETYVRWGKQFREFPELFMGRHGIEFPAPLIQRMMSKANPNIGTAIDFLGAQNIGGFNGSYENKELREKYGKTVATLAATARHFIPFGIPTQTEKEYKLMDFFMPSSKGFSRWKAKDYFETFILDGDWDGIEATYQACVMNGVDAEKNLDAAIASIKAAQKKELADGVVDLTTAAEKFDAATTPEQRKLFMNKLKKQLKGSEYKAFTKQEAIEKVQSFLDGGEKVTEKDNAYYLMQATSEDIIAEEHLKDLGRKAKQYIKAVDNAPVNDQEAMEKKYAVWFDIDAIVSGANSDIRATKKEMNGKDDEQLMNDIRKTIRNAQSEIDKLDAPR